MSVYASRLDLVALCVAFYELIAQMKQHLSEGILDNQVKRQLQLSEAPLPEEIAYATQLNLLQWLEKAQRHYATLLSARDYELLQQALYAMAALADEIMLLELDWPGQSDWQALLLEKQLFLSCSAGSMLFDHIEKLLDEPHFDQTERQLAGVYLLVLRLGFLGRYRGNSEKIDEYRQSLYRLIDKHNKDKTLPLCTDAYQHQLSSHVQQRLAPISKWFRKMTWAAIAFILLSTALWLGLRWHPDMLLSLQLPSTVSQIEGRDWV